MRLLIIEDDLRLGRSLRRSLQHQGHIVDWVQRDVSFDSEVFSTKFDVVVLEMGLSRQDSLELVKRLSGGNCVKKVLAVTTRERLDEFLDRFGNDIDDFILKPFNLDELYARLRAVTYRGAGLTGAELQQSEALKVDLQTRTIFLEGKSVMLTEREFALFAKLLAHRGSILTKAQLRGAGDSWTEDSDSNSIEVHVHHLRRKLGHDFIKTIHGRGYMIDEPIRIDSC